MNAPAGRISIDLKTHLALCELNFHRCLSLVPGVRQGVAFWAFYVGVNRQLRVTIALLESAPYTSTLEVKQQHTGGEWFSSATWGVRLYHDVNMAEIIRWNRHQHWLPEYAYPNKNMYQPDEKMALNRFFGEWLEHCRKQGMAADANVINLTNLQGGP